MSALHHTEPYDAVKPRFTAHDSVLPHHVQVGQSFLQGKTKLMRVQCTRIRILSWFERARYNALDVDVNGSLAEC